MGLFKYVLYTGCLEEDTQLSGNNRELDVDLPEVKSAKECQKKCQLHPRCKEFNFREKSPFPKNRCRLKWDNMSKYKYADGKCSTCKGWTYGPKYCNEGTIYKNDIKVIRQLSYSALCVFATG